MNQTDTRGRHFPTIRANGGEPARSAPGAGIRTGRGKGSGFSLVELMVAMAIGLIITFAIVQIFSSSRATYQTDEGLARAQENGRFAIEFLSREMRQAGDLGCRQAAEINSGGTTPLAYDNTTAGATSFTGIQGYEFPGTGPSQTYAATAENPTPVGAGWVPAKNSATPTDATLVAAVSGGTGLIPDAIPGTDAVAIQRMDNILPAYAPQADQAQVFVASGPNTLSDGTDRIGVGPAVISNCRRASFFVVSGVGKGSATAPDLTSLDALTHVSDTCKVWSGNPGTAGNITVAATTACASVAQEYHTTSTTNSGAPLVGKLTTTAFYIGQGASGAPALFQRIALWNGNAYGAPATQELVDGIENMQVLYGVDAGFDGTADSYVTADNVAAWNTVVSVHISLLVRSQNVTGTAADLTDDTNTYLLAGPDAATGITIDPVDDKRRRRVFSTTLQLRNRGF